MTTPPPDEPDAGPPPPPPPPPAAPTPAAPPEYAGFAPVPRPPRMPWVNPVRRNQFVGSAIVASLLLVGAGFGIGYAVGGSDDNDHGPGRMYPGRYMPYDMRDHMGKQRFLPMPRPSKFPLLGPSTVTVTVTPAAAASS